METICNVGLGFFISWAVLDWIVSPLYGWQTTAIFTVTSIIRQYAIRRLFNGRSVWQAIKGLKTSKRTRVSLGYFSYGRRK
jgi:hypothetical protein